MKEGFYGAIVMTTRIYFTTLSKFDALFRDIDVATLYTEFYSFDKKKKTFSF